MHPLKKDTFGHEKYGQANIIRLDAAIARWWKDSQHCELVVAHWAALMEAKNSWLFVLIMELARYLETSYIVSLTISGNTINIHSTLPAFLTWYFANISQSGKKPNQTNKKSGHFPVPIFGILGQFRPAANLFRETEDGTLTQAGC